MSALVISHRTNMGTQPENTLAGIGAAINDGVDAIEVDVRATADGVPVLMHDASLRRTTGDSRDVAAVTLAELGASRVAGPAGEPGDEAGSQPQPQAVPSLAAALAAVNGLCTLVLEVKQAGIEQAVAAAVRDAGAQQWCWLWSFDPWVAAAAAQALPTVPVSLLAAAGSGKRFGIDSPTQTAAAAGFAGLSLEHSTVTDTSVAEAHELGLAVYTWTVNEDKDIRRVLEAGVDGVCGNYPLRITEVIGGRTPRAG
ncbi:MAG: glycerophosphodiester phosphodiesterase [Dehalococcoidia bacterium]|nr:glycerophosphodiester phosphodiesterase [Dehalococcoidia bacterium]